MLTDKQALLYWYISVGNSDATQLPSREAMEKLMRQQGYINVNYEEVTVKVRFREYNADKIDYQWIYEQLIALAE